MTSLEDLKLAHDSLQAGLDEDEICIREGYIFEVCDASRFGFEFFCWRSPPMVKEMDCFIKYTEGRKRLLDVGAYHGLFSLMFPGQVMAIEPFVESYDILAENIRLNLKAGTILWNHGLSDIAKVTIMHKECGHLVCEESRVYRHVDNPSRVRCISGDELCRVQFFEPDTIKIDVEGHEVKVLRGLQETIKNNRPTIFLEVHTEVLQKQGESVGDILNLLPDYKFIYTGTDKEVDLLIFKAEEPDPRFVCLPR